LAQTAYYRKSNSTNNINNNNNTPDSTNNINNNPVKATEKRSEKSKLINKSEDDLKNAERDYWLQMGKIYARSEMNYFRNAMIQNSKDVLALFAIQKPADPRGYTDQEIAKMLGLIDDGFVTRSNYVTNRYEYPIPEGSILWVSSTDSRREREIKLAFYEHMRGRTAALDEHTHETFYYPADVAPFILKHRTIKQLQNPVPLSECVQSYDYWWFLSQKYIPVVSCKVEFWGPTGAHGIAQWILLDQSQNATQSVVQQTWQNIRDDYYALTVDTSHDSVNRFLYAIRKPSDPRGYSDSEVARFLRLTKDPFAGMGVKISSSADMPFIPPSQLCTWTGDDPVEAQIKDSFRAHMTGRNTIYDDKTGQHFFQPVDVITFLRTHLKQIVEKIKIKKK
jgi:hypothetical protein